MSDSAISSLSSKSMLEQEVSSQKTDTAGPILAALALITLLGVIVGTAFLYQRLGTVAIGIGIGGMLLPIGVSALLFRSCAKLLKNSEPSSTKCLNSDTDSSSDNRIVIFKDTLKKSQEGYRATDGAYVKLNNEKMCQSNHAYQAVDFPPLAQLQQTFQTEFSVIGENFLNVLVDLKKEIDNPVGMYLAPDDLYLDECEDICRRTNYYSALENAEKTAPYFRRETKVLYTNHVQIFRKDGKNNFGLMESPVDVAIVAASERSQNDRFKEMGLASSGRISSNQEIEQEQKKIMDLIKVKIWNTLYAMDQNNHRTLVLGALACKTYCPKKIANIFKEVFEEISFNGRFEKVVFAIPTEKPEDQNIFEAFSEMADTLNHRQKMPPAVFCIGSNWGGTHNSGEVTD